MESGSGESVVYYVGENGFHFSSTVAYKPTTKRMKEYKYKKLTPEKQVILEKEIKELKTIFRTYSTEVEKHYK